MSAPKLLRRSSAPLFSSPSVAAPSSLESLLCTPSGANLFVEFSLSEFSAENIFFWVSVQAFKSKHQHPRLREYWRHVNSVEYLSFKAFQFAGVMSPTPIPPEFLELCSELQEAEPDYLDQFLQLDIESKPTVLAPFADQNKQIAMSQDAIRIYQTFLLDECSLQVNLPHSIMLELQNAFSDADKTDFLPSLTAGVFDRAEVNIWSLMQFNMWPRFATSPFIKLIGSNSSTSFVDPPSSIFSSSRPSTESTASNPFAISSNKSAFNNMLSSRLRGASITSTETMASASSVSSSTFRIPPPSRSFTVRRQRHVPCARSTQKLSIRRQHNVSSNYAHRVLRHRRVPPNPLSMYPATDSQSEITVSRTPSISSFMLSGVSIVSENDKFDVSSSDDEDGLESRMVSSNQRRSSHRRSSSYYDQVSETLELIEHRQRGESLSINVTNASSRITSVSSTPQRSRHASMDCRPRAVHRLIICSKSAGSYSHHSVRARLSLLGRQQPARASTSALLVPLLVRITAFGKRSSLWKRSDTSFTWQPLSAQEHDRPVLWCPPFKSFWSLRLDAVPPAPAIRRSSHRRSKSFSVVDASSLQIALDPTLLPPIPTMAPPPPPKVKPDYRHRRSSTSILPSAMSSFTATLSAPALGRARVVAGLPSQLSSVLESQADEDEAPQSESIAESDYSIVQELAVEVEVQHATIVSLSTNETPAGPVSSLDPPCPAESESATSKPHAVQHPNSEAASNNSDVPVSVADQAQMQSSVSAVRAALQALTAAQQAAKPAFKRRTSVNVGQLAVSEPQASAADVVALAPGDEATQRRKELSGLGIDVSQRLKMFQQSADSNKTPSKFK